MWIDTQVPPQPPQVLRRLPHMSASLLPCCERSHGSFEVLQARLPQWVTVTDAVWSVNADLGVWWGVGRDYDEHIVFFQNAGCSEESFTKSCLLSVSH